MGVMEVRGTLDEIKGKIEKVEDGVWQVEGEVAVATIQTGNNSRDKTILGGQYLDVLNHPVIPFKGLIQNGDGLTMNLKTSIRGIPVELVFHLKALDNELVSFPLVISRKSIGLDFGLMDSLIGDELTLTINSGIEFRELEEW